MVKKSDNSLCQLSPLRLTICTLVLRVEVATTVVVSVPPVKNDRLSNQHLC